MAGYEHTVFTTRVGSIVGTGFGCPRCFRVLDRSGVGMTREPRVDLRTAYRTLARSNQSAATSAPDRADGRPPIR
jgi:hypothetical protein